MVKQIKIRLIDSKTLTYELLEDGNKGDRFSIFSEIEEYANAIIQKKKEEWKKEITNDILQNHFEVKELKEKVSKSASHLQRLDTEKNKIEWANKQLINQIKDLKDNQDQTIKKEVELQKLQIESEKTKTISELEKTISVLKEKNTILQSQKEQIANDKKYEIEKIQQEIKNKQQQIELDNQRKIQEIKDKIQQDNDKKIKESADELAKIKTENYLNQIQELQQKNKEQEEQIARFREKNINSKEIGEELEQWILEKYNHTFPNTGFETSRYVFNFEKDNKVVAGEDGHTKADFIFSIEDKENQKIERIIVEAKTESKFKEGKQKNASFFRTLESNRKKKDAAYAILVTELESKEYFTIEKVSGYEKLYMCRPHFFITLLNILKSLIIKENELLIEIDRAKWDFKESEAIRSEFEDWREKKLIKFANKIREKTEKQQKTIANIITSAQSIEDFLRDLVDKEIANFEKHIGDYKIEKIIKKIDKLNN
ncbi:DUF2130 domain-containing protein [Mesomycoplasma conjunctivae]|uniref:DUF2130 domain-containing protein n=1 Tax=Mesomycoplasma conjunctivae TaxID=45361 RepID=UPI003DA2C842